ncbi:putative protein phosphatase 1K [Paratrimastix pyriformis]|uniref:PPM-type phosphatase domain-containing protein n=1 Tax=Paratrimastix pyriformis TaxID=342808 RepID=A0ABQ8UEV2_9EUKA|nr:putative protein phosphatase 1K [Paratrimastix pyriformis]
MEVTQHQPTEGFAPMEPENVLPAPPDFSRPVLIDMGAYSEIRERDSQQDRYCFKTAPRSTPTLPIAFAGVFDGHGGTFVADYLSRSLPAYVLGDRNLDFSLETLSLTELKEHLTHALLRAQKDLSENYRSSCEHCGSTSCVALIRGKDLLVANTGDSFAFLLASDGEIIQCTRLHKPELPDEKKRITSTGGEVTGIRVPRVTGRTSHARLNISRCFGDFLLTDAGIVPDPELTHIVINPVRHRMVVLCTDGVSPENCLELAARVPSAPPHVVTPEEAQLQTEIEAPRQPGHETPAASTLSGELEPFVPQRVEILEGQTIHPGCTASQLARHEISASAIKTVRDSVRQVRGCSA